VFRIRLPLGGISMFGLILIAGCPDQPTGDGSQNIDGPYNPTSSRTISGTIEADSITVPAGVTLTVVGDLTLRSRGAAEIAGEVVADGNAGHPVVIDAQDDIVVSGRVIAGNGNGGDGGILALVIANGSITLQDGSEIAADAAGLQHYVFLSPRE